MKPLVLTAVPGYAPAIDGLRAVAILAVVAYHAGLAWLPGGFLGVDVFFVISGFLIGRIIITDLLAKRFSFFTFYDRRIRRILPAMAGMLAGTTLAAWLILMPNQWAQFGTELMAASVGVANIGYALKQDYFAPASEFLPLLHLWSLAVEEQFYFVIPLALWACYRWYAAAAQRLILGALVTSLGLWLVLHTFFAAPTLAFFALPSRAWALLAGVWLAHQVVTHASWLKRLPLASSGWFGFGMIGFGYLLPANFLPNLFVSTGILWLFPVGGSILVLAATYAARTQANLPKSLGWLATPPMVGIGLISYSLYLWHWPVLVHLTHATNGAVWGFNLWAIAAVAIGGLSYASWRWLEQPLRHGNWGWHSVRQRYLVVAALSVIFLGLGGLIWQKILPAAGQPSAAAMANLKPKAGVSPWRDNCHFQEAQFGQWQRTCVLGAPSTPPRVIVWADSHGVELAASLANALERRGEALRQITASGCPPVLGFKPSGRPTCPMHNAKILTALQLTSPSTIILAANYQNYLKTTSAELFYLQFSKTIKFLQQAGHRVIVFGQVPNWAYPVPEAAARNELNHQPFLRRPMLPADSMIDLKLLHVLGQSVDFIFPAKLFCNTLTGCSADTAQGLRYFDTNHLSMTGATELTTQLLPLLPK